MDNKKIQHITRCHNQFLNTIHNTNKSISDYFQLDPNITITWTRMLDDTFMLIYHYETKPPLIAQFNLPTELQYYIKSFLQKKVTIHSQLFYPRDYPFRAPKWTLVSTTLSLFEPDKNFKFYNRQLEDSWLPCSNIESDILNYLVWLIPQIII